MKRIDRIKNMTTEEMARWLIQLNDEDLGGLYCKSDCEDTWEDPICPHPTDCLIRWLEEEDIS